MPNFSSGPGGINLENGFLTEAELLERFVGNQLWIWGSNLNAQLGDNTGVSRSSPVQTVSSGTNWTLVNTGGYHTAAIKTDGSLWIWGFNSYGQLGTNNTTNRSSPVQTVSTGTNWQSVNMGYAHTAAIKTDGTLWTWGRNSYGQLGNNSIAHRSSPVQTVSSGTNWKLVCSGRNNTTAIKTDGTLWLWGNNVAGQLGNNSTTNQSSPVQTVSGGTNWTLVNTGGYHTAAIKTDGTLWIWGRNSYGQLGNNSTTNRSSPVQTVSGGTNWKSVSSGASHTAAIKTDGTLWTWGSNSYGQLGDNTRTHRSSPVQTISGGTVWKSVSTNNNTAAIKTDGTLWLWGYNAGGQLGNNSLTNQSSPVQTAAGGNNWKSVSTGDLHATAVTFRES